MNRSPLFHKETPKISQQDFIRNIWCRYYSKCLDEAAMGDVLMDCSQCGNLTVDFRSEWHNRYLDYCLE